MLRAQETRLESLRQRLEDLAAKRVLTDQLAYVQDKRMDLLHAQQRLGDLSEVLLNRKNTTSYTSKNDRATIGLGRLLLLPVAVRDHRPNTDGEPVEAEPVFFNAHSDYQRPDFLYLAARR